MSNVQHIFIIGAKGLGNYGGYETFIDKLTEMHQDRRNMKYHVACKQNGKGMMDEAVLNNATTIDENHFEYHNADCFKIHVPEAIGSAQAIYYDVKAMKYVISYCRKNNISSPIVYVLACRIGPFFGLLTRKVHALGGKVFVNPDGHEWMRAKWSKPVRKYWKESERGMVKHADLMICDSVNIEKYIHEEYAKYNPQTTYIAYGADIAATDMKNDSADWKAWLREKGLQEKQYYLVVGRFVPENNFETMIREFMMSSSDKNLVIITTKDDAFLNALDEKLHFKADSRIRFVGTVYDQSLLQKIRVNAYGYIHGHSVGGTNPSLLEALGTTKINLLLNVGFNKEVGQDAALYWGKETGQLANVINELDGWNQERIDKLGVKAKKRIEDAYSWKFIANRYEEVFGE